MKYNSHMPIFTPYSLVIGILGLAIGMLVGVSVCTPIIGGKHKRTCQRKIAALKSKLQARLHARVKERLDTLYDLTYTLATTLNYQRVLEMILDIALQTFAAEGKQQNLLGAVLLFDEKGVLKVASARHFPPSDRRKQFAAAEGALAKVVSEREPIRLNNPASDPELRQLIAIQAAKSAYLLPLAVGLDVYGVVLFAAGEPNYFTDEQVEMLGALTRQAGIALQNARLYEDLQHEKQRLAETEEEARKKLARDLHDGPTQTIAAIAMRASYISRLMDKDPKAAKEEIKRIEELARRTTKEIRHLLFTLRPLVLESEGLVPALEAMAEKMRQLYDQNVIIEADQNAVDAMDSLRQTVAFYVAEEAVNNARKHAEAAHIWVRLRLVRPDIALLEVQDDGKGFDVASVGANYERRGSLGMVNLRERAAMVNGHLELHSAPGRGTAVRLWIPLTDDAAQRLQAGKLG